MVSRRLEIRYEKLDNIREILEHDARDPLTVVLAGSECVRDSYGSHEGRYSEWDVLYEKTLGMKSELDDLRAERFTFPEKVSPVGMSQLAIMRNCETMLEKGAKKIVESAFCVKKYCERDLVKGGHKYVGMIRDNAEKIINMASPAASGDFLQDVGKKFS